jgi:hypothetical protein
MLLDIDESYIFTDNDRFVQEWTAATQKCTHSNYPSILRSILASYFGVVTEGVANQVPKLIVFQVRKTLRGMQAHMYTALHETQDVSHLLFETEEIEQLRHSLTNTITTADECLRAIDEVLRGAET